VESNSVRIFTEGGAATGFGHVARCLGLYDAFEERGLKCELIVDGDNSVRRFLGDRICAVAKWADADYLHLALKGESVSVIDSYLAPRQVYLALAERSRLCVCIDDYGRIEYPAGIVVRSTPIAGGPIDPTSAAVMHLTGPEYHLVRRAFWDVEPKAVVPQEVGRILVTLGGTVRSGLLEAVLALVLERFPAGLVHVVVGRDSRKPVSQPKIGVRLEVHGALTSDEMRNLMLGADLAVSAGGQTMFELARCGVPAVAVVIAENQRENVHGFVARGTALYGGRDGDPALWDILSSALEGVTAAEKRRDLSEAGQKLIDGQGPRRIAGIVMEHLS
jgi:spore coat polysaccharide biosynthesis predicted glycosyltransferase SpsG